MLARTSAGADFAGESSPICRIGMTAEHLAEIERRMEKIDGTVFRLRK